MSLQQPVSCVASECERFQIPHYNGPKTCMKCGGDMFPTPDTGEDFPSDVFFINDHKQRPNVEPKIIRQNGTFHCKPDLVGCPIAKEPKVYIPLDLFNKWMYLACEFDTEWIAYLKGKEIKPGEFKIASMYFPKQTAGPAHVEADDRQIQGGATVAAVHSHVGMNVFFSDEDKRHFNHPIELVINRSGEILANGRTKLECGRWHRGPAEILFTNCEEEIALVDALSAKLTEARTWQAETSPYKKDGGPGTAKPVNLNGMLF